mmetsp:Transcript_19717/g.24866  ORF Transcript_19717/g.24866 Transcript_19717/m.24866 type:complete len:397 (-) Transcript_19717:211-1401(-)
MMNRHNNYQTVSRLLQRLSGVYRDPSRVINDSTSLLNSDAGRHLRPDISDLLLNDGTSMRSLRLHGTIQMMYRGASYHIPIDLHLPPNYGVRPPMIFVRPVPSMMIKQGHKHVGSDGMVYMPYLHSWRPRSHNLIDTVTSMARLFGEDPPVFSRPAGSVAAAPAPTPPPPPQYHHVTEEQERIRRMEMEANEANEAVRIAREAEAREVEDNRLAAESKQRLRDKAKFMLDSYSESSKREIAGHLEDQILLGKSASFVTGAKGAGISTGGQMEYFTKRKEELEKHHSDMDESIQKLEDYIKEVEQSKKTTDQIDVDELAMPADIHSAQMLILSAENAAIHDALYFLDKGLSDNKISMDVHLKTVRRLARRQFLIKAHLLKIGQVKASEYARGFPTWQ